MARKAARAPRTLSTVELWRQRINEQMGREVVEYATSTRYAPIRIPTGILTLDRITGGGYVRGRHVELYGDWQGGKSYAVYRCIAEAQRRGEICALIDGEHVFDAGWFTALGGNANDLLIRRPDNAEEVVKALQLFTQEDELLGKIGVVGVDSVASLLPDEILKKDVDEGDDRVGALARFMSRGLPRITTLNRDTLFLWTNQWRDKISRIPNLKSTPGGRALGFYASTRIEMVLGEKEKVERQVVSKGKWGNRKMTTGQWVYVTTTKNKTTAPYQEAMFMFDFGDNKINEDREIVDLGMQDKVIARDGDYYSVTLDSGRKVRCHGIRRFLDTLASDSELRSELVELITINSQTNGN